MKKTFLAFVMSAMCMFSYAQSEVTVKAGTIVPLQVVNPTKAADVEEGQKVLFRVSRDIMVNGKTAIPYGTTVQGTVYESKKSAWFGTKGRLGIKINEIVCNDGVVVPITNGDVYVTRKNRTAVSILVFAFTFLPIPCGTKAQLPSGYEIQANVAANTIVKVD